jgi:hypothetical protein
MSGRPAEARNDLRDMGIMEKSNRLFGFRDSPVKKLHGYNSSEAIHTAKRFEI